MGKELLVSDEPKHILFCPLDWGIGHATRCIPLIRKFIDDGHTVTIGSCKTIRDLLKKEFPDLQYFLFPTFYNIYYSRSNSQVLKMASLAPQIIKGIHQENKFLQKVIDDLKIDVVVSDNRFGLWSNKAKTIYLTHQMLVKMPIYLKFLEPIGWYLHRRYIVKYDECWIPDFADPKQSIAGDLSHKYPLPPNAKFIGLISRFRHREETDNIEKSLPVLCIVSGPEPQRSMFEEKLVEEFKGKDFKVEIVKGIPSENTITCTEDNITFYNHLTQNEMEQKILSAHHIICRSGYSSIMDMVTLGRRAVLVPTPGQTEQEYLAKYLSKKGLFDTISQRKFNSEFVLNISY